LASRPLNCNFCNSRLVIFIALFHQQHQQHQQNEMVICQQQKINRAGADKMCQTKPEFLEISNRLSKELNEEMSADACT
jgi:hypothetical protein